MRHSPMDLDVVIIDTGDGDVVARLLLAGRLVWATPPTAGDEQALEVLQDTFAQALQSLMEATHARR